MCAQKKKRKCPAKDNLTAIKVGLFFSFVPEFASKLIVRVTGKKLDNKSDAYSHCGVVFEMSDGKIIYYEALFSEGFSGPKPIKKLQAKIIKNDGRFCFWWLSLDSAVAEQVRLRCENWVGTRGYYAWQLASMWWFERVGRHFGWHVPASPSKMVCSEACARSLFPWIDLRDNDHPRFDEVNPNSVYRRTVEIDILGAARWVCCG